MARRTEILATIGPASAEPVTIAALLAAGADAFRLNFSHGTIDSHRELCRRIRAAAAEAGRDVAILQDLPGPKMRLGPVDEPFGVSPGDQLAIELGDFNGTPGRVATTFEPLFTSVRQGNRLLVNDGRIELEVESVSPGKLATRVISGGLVEARKGINVPGAALRTPALTNKDLEDLQAGLAMGVDLVAISFVQSPDDILRARAAAAAAGAPDLPIFAKIERPHAVSQIDDIAAVSDGIMVARGDLGIELPIETLPAVQKRIVMAARRRGVPVIVATQVLESMCSSPRPTRAEVNDAAHAVDEGADAIMLADETAIGHYPVESVRTLDAIIREAERSPMPVGPQAFDASAWSEHGRALCEAAVALADHAKAAAIIAVTESGKTARMLAALRPAARILAATPNARTAARLALLWGVTPIVTEQTSLAAIRGLLSARALVPSGAIVVFVSMHATLGPEGANFVHVERV